MMIDCELDIAPEVEAGEFVILVGRFVYLPDVVGAHDRHHASSVTM